MTGSSGRLRRRLLAVTAGAAAISLLASPALAHGGGLGNVGGRAVSIPTWLVVLTGGGAVGASFVLASFVTDRQLIGAVDGWRRQLPTPGRVLVGLTRLIGVGALGLTVLVGGLGPPSARANLGLLIVWVGWWAGYTMTTYLAGNSWPVVNPWRTIASGLPSLDRTYPVRLGAWPATVALLGFIWLEVASPVSDAPGVLVIVVVAYTVVTLTGAWVYGAGTWFDSADPVARVFGCYGRVAPLSADGDGVSVRLPGAGLTELSLRDRTEVGFIVALLWVTTFDGLVSTAAWTNVEGVLVGAGVPLDVLLPVTLLAGFMTFMGIFLAASRASRVMGDSCLTAGELARQFAPSLLPIAAGYHLAHYLGYFLSLAPSIPAVAAAPFDPPPSVPVLALPGWFDLVGMVAILLGHLLAIWVAHATAYDLFPGRLQAIRSQYPFIAVMVVYTMTSLWIVAQPEAVGL